MLAVVGAVRSVNRIRNLFLSARFKHTLVREKDYVRFPKESGYRGVHLVYRYYSDRNETYDGLQIEVQYPKKRAFLCAFALLGSKSRAAEAASIDRTKIYTPDWLGDEQFQAALERARLMALDVLEAEAHRRAVEGVDEPVSWYKGKTGGVIRRYSDVLLMYLAEDLKHHRQVAAKVLRPELAAVLGAERFVQEIKTTANLQHPHILRLFDSGEADGPVVPDALLSACHSVR